MSDAKDNALTVAARQLPARAALADRGLMLASRVAVVRQRAEAKQRLKQAWRDWVYLHGPQDGPDVPYDGEVQYAIRVFDNAVSAAALWFGIELTGSSSFAAELVQGAAWRAWQDERWRQLREDGIDGWGQPWICGGMEELAGVIEKLRSGTQLADTGVDPKYDLIIESMLLLEELDHLFGHTGPESEQGTDSPVV